MDQQLVNRLRQHIAARSLLDHPFYQDWRQGKLTIEDLRAAVVGTTAVVRALRVGPVVDVVGHVQIQPAVSIQVEHRDRCGPRRVVDSRRGGDVPERAIALVQEQAIGAEVAEIHVGVAVVVDIADGHAHAVTGVGQSAGDRDILEATIVGLAVQPIGHRRVGHRLASIVHCAAVDQVQVEVSVAIEIEQRSPGRDHLGHEEPTGLSRIVDKVHRQAIGGVFKENRLAAGAAGVGPCTVGVATVAVAVAVSLAPGAHTTISTADPFDFTVTLNGLAEHLLSLVYRMEKPHVERQREELLRDITGQKVKLRDLERDLLYRLSNTKGNLVDYTELMDVLNMTKTTTVQVQAKLEDATKTQAVIQATREEYLAVAERGSILYFLIAEMGLVNHM